MMRPIVGQFAGRPSESAHPRLWDGLTVGFAPCVTGAGRDVVDLSPNRYDFVFVGSAAALSVEASPVGQALKFAGNVALEQQDASWGLPCKILTASDEDVVVISTVFKFVHSGGAKESTIFWSDNPTVGSNLYGYRVWVDNNTDKLRFGVWNAYNDPVSGTSTRYTSATTLTAGRWYRATVVFYPLMESDAPLYGQRCMMFIDGVLEFPTVGPGNFPSSTGQNNGSHLTTQHSRVGSTLGSTAPDISVALINVWNKQWFGVWDGGTDSLESAKATISQINADPLAMYRRRRRGSGAKGSRLVTIGGTALRRLNVAVAG